MVYGFGRMLLSVWLWAYGLALGVWLLGIWFWAYGYGRMGLGAQPCKRSQAKLRSIHKHPAITDGQNPKIHPHSESSRTTG